MFNSHWVVGMGLYVLQMRGKGGPPDIVTVKMRSTLWKQLRAWPYFSVPEMDTWLLKWSNFTQETWLRIEANSPLARKPAQALCGTQTPLKPEGLGITCVAHRPHLHHKCFAGVAMPAETPTADASAAKRRSFSLGTVTQPPQTTLARLTQALFC